MRNLSLIFKMALVSVLALMCASCGPRMRQQASIRPFERQMPAQAEGVVPTSGSLDAFTLQQSNLAANPMPKTASNLRNGEIYYGYYCLMCHGAKGDGGGPVGDGYVPKPTDLSSPRVAAMTDGHVYGAMLSGVGHDPVMSQTVHPDQRWPLVMHVRTFAEARRE